MSGGGHRCVIHIDRIRHAASESLDHCAVGQVHLLGVGSEPPLHARFEVMRAEGVGQRGLEIIQPSLMVCGINVDAPVRVFLNDINVRCVLKETR